MALKKSDYDYSIGLVIRKLEFDGNEIASFNLLDYEEIITFDNLISKLEDFYHKGLEKIKELKIQLKRK